MTPEQHYSRKMAELLDDNSGIKINIKHYIACGNDIGLEQYYNELQFHSCWKWQIPVWQKVYAIIHSGKLPLSVFWKLMELELLYSESIAKSTPAESFAILCKCIDLIENNTK